MNIFNLVGETVANIYFHGHADVEVSGGFGKFRITVDDPKHRMVAFDSEFPAQVKNVVYTGNTDYRVLELTTDKGVYTLCMVRNGGGPVAPVIAFKDNTKLAKLRKIREQWDQTKYVKPVTLLSRRDQGSLWRQVPSIDTHVWQADMEYAIVEITKENSCASKN